MRRFGLALVAVVVVACGGGGGGPAGPVDVTSAPTRPSNDSVVLPNSTWVIASIDGTASTADPPTKVFIGLPDAFNGLQISGVCKTVFGTYKLSGASLTPALDPGDTSECAADAAAYRQSILEALNGVTAYSLAGTTLTLTGAKTIVLQRA
jgi:heat shock protein HslJ